MTGLTTETAQTVALPDGTFRSTVHAAPMRTRNDSGAWVDVDLTLERQADGSVAAGAHAYGLWLSGARSTASDGLVAVGVGAQRVTLGWRGALPEPQLAGAKATYVNVKPGVDLVVEARRTGFRYSFVVWTPTAAAGMASVAMPWSGGAVDPSGRASDLGPALSVSQGEMWDARLSPAGEPVYRADVAVTTEPNGSGGADLVLTPDPAFYQDPQLTFPVTIDPSINLSPAFDAYVQDNAQTTDKSGEEDLRLGHVYDPNRGCGGDGCTARSLLSFHRLGGLDGSTVIKAELFLYNFHSWSCTEASWEAWRVSWADSSARWGNQPTWEQRDSTSTATKGYSGCDGGWVSVSVKNTFQTVFDSPDRNWAHIGLRATNESTSEGWKKFNSSEAPSRPPYVELVYNHRPNVPTGGKVDSCYSACASPAVVRSGSPQLWATVTDPNGGTLRTEYEVWDNAKQVLKARSGTAVTGVASGSARPWRVVATGGGGLLDGTYHWRVRACDSQVCGNYSGWFTITVNTQDPSLPTVTGTPYAEKPTGTWNGGPGQAGQFTFTPNGTAEVVEYTYDLDGGNAVTVPAGAAQFERLTVNQQQVSTDLTGFSAGAAATIARSTARGHNSSDSLQITPDATGSHSSYHSYAAVGGDAGGGFRLAMQPGKRYWVTGWIFVPAATGLAPATTNGLRLAPTYVLNGVHTHVLSDAPAVTDTWVPLSAVMSVPSTATEAYLRIWNGFAIGSGKSVFWDDLSVREMFGTTTAASITPARDGLNVLSVQSRTAAGFTSDPRVYQFLVTPSTDAWHWTLDEGTGTTAGSVPNTRPATFGGSGVSWTEPGRVGDAAVTLGGSGQLTTASPVLNTTHAAGFTVAAWARLTDMSANRAAVSQDGVNTSMFRLGYRNDRDVNGDAVPDPAWCFTVAASDSASAAQAAACTTDYVIEGDWVALVGVYDNTNDKIKLYVNGTPGMAGSYVETDSPTAWSATGPFAIGRALNSSTPAERWVGDIDHAYAVQQVWADSEIRSFARL